MTLVLRPHNLWGNLFKSLKSCVFRFNKKPLSATLLRRDKERYVRGLAEDVECHLNANVLRPAYRALKKLRSKSTSQVSAIQTADGCLVSDADGQMALWPEYFEQLFMVDPPS